MHRIYNTISISPRRMFPDRSCSILLLTNYLQYPRPPLIYELQPQLICGDTFISYDILVNLLGSHPHTHHLRTYSPPNQHHDIFLRGSRQYAPSPSPHRTNRPTSLPTPRRMHRNQPMLHRLLHFPQHHRRLQLPNRSRSGVPAQGCWVHTTFIVLIRERRSAMLYERLYCD